MYVNKFVMEYIRIYHKMFGNIYDHVQSLKSAIILSVEQAGRISQVFIYSVKLSSITFLVSQKKKLVLIQIKNYRLLKDNETTPKDIFLIKSMSLREIFPSTKDIFR